jgi:hypothetical protein
MLHLNRVLFHVSEIDIASSNNNDEDEDDDDGKNLPSESSTMDTTTTNYIAKVTLSRDDYRAIHVAKILKLQNGDTLRVGVVRHRPRSTNHHHHHHQHHHGNNNNNNTLAGLRTDNATIVWIAEGKNKVGAPTKNGDPPGSLCITIPHPPPPITTSSSSTSLTTSIMNQIITAVDDYDNDKENVAPTIPNNDKSASTNSTTTTINYKDNDDDVPRVSLLLALPRPLQLQRILPMVAQLGVEHILLTNANKVPKDYFGCRILRNSIITTITTAMIMMII